jgi:kanamycin kinase/aminoglycoside 3'-phosphotransferase-2
MNNSNINSKIIDDSNAIDESKIIEIFSDNIKKQIGHDDVKLIFEGALACTYLLEGADGTRRFLKVQDADSYEPLNIQKQRLEWLAGKLPVPKVLYYEKTSDNEYMITAEIPGIDGISKFPEEALQDIVVTIAKGLKTIHSIPIEDCPYDNSLKNYLTIARNSFYEGRVDPEELITKFGYGDVEKAYRELLDISGEIVEELVFTHGDYSMPNVMLKDGEISGFLDLGGCGMADPYADLAIAEKSIIRNYGEEYVNLFYKAYGIDSPDRKKVKL